MSLSERDAPQAHGEVGMSTRALMVKVRDTTLVVRVEPGDVLAVLMPADDASFAVPVCTVEVTAEGVNAALP